MFGVKRLTKCLWFLGMTMWLTWLWACKQRDQTFIKRVSHLSVVSHHFVKTLSSVWSKRSSRGDVVLQGHQAEDALCPLSPVWRQSGQDVKPSAARDAATGRLHFGVLLCKHFADTGQLWRQKIKTSQSHKKTVFWGGRKVRWFTRTSGKKQKVISVPKVTLLLWSWKWTLMIFLSVLAVWWHFHKPQSDRPLEMNWWLFH